MSCQTIDYKGIKVTKQEFDYYKSLPSDDEAKITASDIIIDRHKHKRDLERKNAEAVERYNRRNKKDYIKNTLAESFDNYTNASHNEAVENNEKVIFIDLKVFMREIGLSYLLHHPHIHEDIIEEDRSDIVSIELGKESFSKKEINYKPDQLKVFIDELEKAVNMIKAQPSCPFYVFLGSFSTELAKYKDKYEKKLPITILEIDNTKKLIDDSVKLWRYCQHDNIKAQIDQAKVRIDQVIFTDTTNKNAFTEVMEKFIDRYNMDIEYYYKYKQRLIDYDGRILKRIIRAIDDEYDLLKFYNNKNKLKVSNVNREPCFIVYDMDINTRNKLKDTFPNLLKDWIREEFSVDNQQLITESLDKKTAIGYNKFNEEYEADKKKISLIPHLSLIDATKYPNSRIIRIGASYNYDPDYDYNPSFKKIRRSDVVSIYNPFKYYILLSKFKDLIIYEK